MSPGAGPTAQLTPALRALGLLLLIDLGAGLWLKLHDPGNLALFFIVNAPVVGLGSLIWGLLPKTEQEAAGSWVSSVLGSPWVARVALAVGVALFVVSLCFSSIEIDLVDPNGAANILVVRGSQDDPDSVAVRTADTIRVNRLTTPAHHVMQISPLGSRLWLHSATLTSYQDIKLWPWSPASFQYPDDFVPLAAIAVLPADTLVLRMRDSLWLTLHQGSRGGRLLAQELLARSGFTVGYFEPSLPPSPALLQRWGDSLAAQVKTADSASRRRFVSDQVAVWARGGWVHAHLPLRVGETVFWDVRDRSGAVEAEDTLRVTDAISDLHLRF